MTSRAALLALALSVGLAGAARADDLFNPNWAASAGDRHAMHVGDVLTVLVYQSAEARNAAANSSRTQRSFEGGLRAGSVDENAQLALDGTYSGQGEVRRSESFVTQISVNVEEVLPNGDLRIAGSQHLSVNGETTLVRVSGRVRPADINGDNQILSTRIAEAEISYDGEGFVSRNARPGLLHRILGFLGLGG